MSERWVLNASPIIVVARVGQEHLFDALVDEVVVPRAVVEEIQAGPTGDPGRQVIASGRFTFVDATPVPEVLAWDPGMGETAVLSYALKEFERTVIVDDAAARRCAQSFDLPFQGTLAVVVLAKQHGLIPFAADILRSLLKGGFRLNEGVIREVLSRTVDEQWE